LGRQQPLTLGYRAAGVLLHWPRQRGRRRAEGALQLEPRATPWEAGVPGHRGAL